MPCSTFVIMPLVRTRLQTCSIGSMPPNCTRQARATELIVSPVASETRCRWWLVIIPRPPAAKSVHGRYRLRESRGQPPMFSPPKKFSHYHLASLPRLSAVGTEDILAARVAGIQAAPHRLSPLSPERRRLDRKSTRLNSSH